jgi:CheY-like chemotaxis protein
MNTLLNTSPSQQRLRVLCVDDEPAVLEGIEQHLRRRYDVRIATSGSNGLEVLEREGPFAIILSDMRMPSMNGAVFLAKAKEKSPQSVRMLLTGQTDIESAIAAINEGQIFRFLMKPCPPDRLLSIFELAADQYRLIIAERELLEKTVRGCVKALTDLLELSNPIAFGRARRMSQMVVRLCDKLNVQDRWYIEVASMVSQLGAFALSDELAEKYYYGRTLTTAEKQSIAEMPKHAQRLLGSIPRLEPVIDLLKRHDDFSRVPTKNPSLDVQILVLAADFEELQSRGMDAYSALDAMRGRGLRYDPQKLQMLIDPEEDEEHQTQQIKELAFGAIQEGMVFAQDVRTEAGMLLVGRGFEVTLSFVERAKSFKRGYVKEPVLVIVPKRSV